LKEDEDDLALEVQEKLQDAMQRMGKSKENWELSQEAFEGAKRDIQDASQQIAEAERMASRQGIEIRSKRERNDALEIAAAARQKVGGGVTSEFQQLLAEGQKQLDMESARTSRLQVVPESARKEEALDDKMKKLRARRALEEDKARLRGERAVDSPKQLGSEIPNGIPSQRQLDVDRA
jgi:hypothetical protein